MLKAKEIKQGHTLYSIHEHWNRVSKELGVPVSMTKWFVAGKCYERKPAGEIDLNLNITKARDMANKGFVFFKSKRKARSFMNNYIHHTATPIYFG